MRNQSAKNSFLVFYYKRFFLNVSLFIFVSTYHNTETAQKLRRIPCVQLSVLNVPIRYHRAEVYPLLRR